MKSMSLGVRLMDFQSRPPSSNRTSAWAAPGSRFEFRLSGAELVGRQVAVGGPCRPAQPEGRAELSSSALFQREACCGCRWPWRGLPAATGVVVVGGVEELRCRMGRTPFVTSATKRMLSPLAVYS